MELTRPDSRMKTTPYAHQAREFNISKDLPMRALLWQMRTGKTKLVIDEACHLWCKGEIDGIIIIAPNGVHDNWIRREFPVHAWDCVPSKVFTYNQSLLTSRKWYQGKFDEFLAPVYEMGWLAINVEAVQFDVCKKSIMRFMKQYPNFMIVFDESHKFGTPGAARTKRVRGLAKKAKYRRILTGSVIDNSPLKAYSQFELLAPKALGFRDYAHFKDTYAEYEQGYAGKRTYDKLVGYRNLEDLRSRIAKFSSVVLREDCEDLPEVVKAPVYLEMTAKQKEHYRTAVDELYVAVENGEIDDIEVEIMEGGPLGMKLRQISSGFIIDSETGDTHDLVPWNKNPKVEALLELLEDNDEKLIVWCNFRYEIDNLYAILKKAGYRPVRYYGKVKDAEKVKAIDSFMSDTSVRVFLGQPVSAGEGLNLSSASGMVWYSHTYDATVRNQANERATVVGGKSIWLSDFVYDGLIETKILENLDMKEKTRKFVIGDEFKRMVKKLDDQALKEKS